MLYQVHQLKDTTRPGTPGLVEYVQQLTRDLTDQGISVFGLFGSLLGLASNQVYLVTYSETQARLPLTPGIELIESTLLEPTVRPVSHAPRTEPGVYVFRWFSVAPDTVDEIVALSAEAWPGFEGNFDTRIQGLFVEKTDRPTTMLLITWYRDLSVWEASRQPPAEARENFIRRHHLTLGALPVATTLLSESGGTGLVSHT